MAMYQFSLIAEDKVKPLLDPDQWAKLQPKLEEFESFRADLVNRGLLEPEATRIAENDSDGQNKEPK